jgi:D-alanyl-lipoteichoic acid acyltransferase DltB (MBOAT superfamily)
MISYTSFAFFIIYFGATYLLYSIMPVRWKWCVLLLGSWFFYFVSSKGHVIPLLISTFAVWGAGMLLQKINDDFKAKKKGLKRDERKKLKKQYSKYRGLTTALGIAVTLGLLLVCKYSNFFIGTVNGITGASFGEVDIIQPLGISFYTLQAISYIVDVSSGKYKAVKNPLRVSLYLSFMLTIVEGPIARYDKLGVQLENLKLFNPQDFVWGAQRVVWGLFKKVVIADRAAELVNAVFDNPEEHGGIVVIAAILFYTLQLYLEFSGVMDVMCGLGETFGIEMPENFTRPFFAKTINEFWQRWHITLGSWLRDYIFYPISFSKPFMKLSKSAREKFNAYYANLIPTSVALFFVWFSNGFWHGAGWKYIVYGLYYYVLMMIGMFLEPVSAKVCKALKINRDSKGFGLFRMLRTFVIVNFGMLIFRADSLRIAFDMVVSIFTRFSLSALLPGANNKLGLDLFDYAIVLLGAAVVFAVSLMSEKGINIRERIARLPFIVKFVGFILAVLVIVIFGAYGETYGVQDLIYANF